MSKTIIVKIECLLCIWDNKEVTVIGYNEEHVKRLVDEIWGLAVTLGIRGNGNIIPLSFENQKT